MGRFPVYSASCTLALSQPRATAATQRHNHTETHARTYTHTHIPLPCRPVPFTHARRVAGKDATQGEACLLLRALRRDLGSASPIYDTALRVLPLEQGQVLQWCVRTRRRLPSCARARADAPCARPCRLSTLDTASALPAPGQPLFRCAAHDAPDAV